MHNRYVYVNQIIQIKNKLINLGSEVVTEKFLLDFCDVYQIKLFESRRIWFINWTISTGVLIE